MSLEADPMFKECLSLLKMAQVELPAAGSLAVLAVSPQIPALESSLSVYTYSILTAELQMKEAALPFQEPQSTI